MLQQSSYQASKAWAVLVGHSQKEKLLDDGLRVRGATVSRLYSIIWSQLKLTTGTSTALHTDGIDFTAEQRSSWTGYRVSNTGPKLRTSSTADKTLDVYS